MVEVKISTFLISLIAVSLVTVFFMSFIAGSSPYYNVAFDNSTLVKIDKMNNLTSISNNLREQSQQIETKQDLADILGGYFNDAYTSIQLSFQSIGLFNDIANEGVKHLGLGSLSGITYTAIITIVLLLLLIGVLMSAIVKKEM